MEGRTDNQKEDYAASFVERDRLLSVPLQLRAEALHESERNFLIVEEHAATVRASIGSDIAEQERQRWNRSVLEADEKARHTGKYVRELIELFVGHLFAVSEDIAALEAEMMSKVTKDIKDGNRSAVNILRIYPTFDTLVRGVIRKTRKLTPAPVAPVVAAPSVARPAASIVERDQLLSVPVQDRAEALYKSEKNFLIIEEHAAEVRASIGLDVEKQTRQLWNKNVLLMEQFGRQKAHAELLSYQQSLIERAKRRCRGATGISSQGEIEGLLVQMLEDDKAQGTHVAHKVARMVREDAEILRGMVEAVFENNRMPPPVQEIVPPPAPVHTQARPAPRQLNNKPLETTAFVKLVRIAPLVAILTALLVFIFVVAAFSDWSFFKIFAVDAVVIGLAYYFINARKVSE